MLSHTILMGTLKIETGFQFVYIQHGIGTIMTIITKQVYGLLPVISACVWDGPRINRVA